MPDAARADLKQPSLRAHPRPGPRILFLLLAGVMIGWCGVFIARSSFIAIDGHRYYSLFDDAMISMRYAWNLVHGHGLVWNPGQPPVEGITNLLMTLYMALGAVVLNKTDAVLFVQVSGIPILLGIGVVSAKVADLVCGDLPPATRRLCRAFAFVSPVLYYPLAYWTLLGMETGLLTLLLLAALLIILERDRQARFTPLIPVLLGLAFLTRPDSPVLAIVLLTYRYVRLPRGSIGLIVRELAILGAIGGAATLFRLAYYHSVVPNTYTLKMTGMPLGTRLLNGLGFVYPFLQTAWPALGLALFGVLARPRPVTRMLAILVGVALLYQVWTGGDPWPYWRMLAPVMPIVFILSLDALCWAAQALRGRMLLVVVAMVTVYLCADSAFSGEMTFREPAAQVVSNQGDVDESLALDAVTTTRATIAVIWAGTLPYYSGRPAIDLLGKSDPYIAHLAPDLSGDIAWNGMTSVPGHNKYDLRYSILRLRPTYTQTLIWGRQDLTKSAAMYRWFSYRGVRLLLDTTSHDVRWPLVKGG